MRNHLHLRAAIVTMLGICLSSPAFAQTPQQPQQEVSKALTDLESWLGKGANGQKWREVLQTQSLHAQLAKGKDADPNEVEKVLDQFYQPKSGLEMPRFVRVRNAIDAWLNTLPASTRDELAKKSLGVKDQFTPISQAAADQAKANLAAATAKLNAHLAKGKYGPGWKQYLHWDQLQSQLKAEQPDPTALEEVAGQIGADVNGLEQKPFAETRAALREYMNLAAAATAKDMQAEYGTKLDALAKDLDEYAKKPSPTLASSIGKQVGWLRRNRQARPLVRAIRRNYFSPNLYASASADLVGAGIRRPVDQVLPVRDNILGTSITGTGHTVGKLDTRLVPNSQHALLETFLIGNTATQTVGYHGPAIVYACGNTSIYGSERMIMDALGFRSTSATAKAVTHTTITGIGTTKRGLIGRMVLKKAPQRAAEGKADAEYVSARHAEGKIRDRLHREVVTNLAKANTNYLTKFRNPLLRRGEFPSRLEFSTTADHLNITCLHANAEQLGAPSEPPQSASPAALSVRAHESIVNNYAASLMAGRTFTREEYERDQGKRKGMMPDEFKDVPPPDENEADWEMTLASPPVTLTLGDGTGRIVIHVQRYSSGGREYKQAMNVTADYEMSIFENRLRLNRQGDITVEPPTQQKQGFAVGLKPILRKKFGRVMLEQLTFKQLELPGAWKAAGPLDLVNLQSGAGWVALGWNRQGESNAKPVAAAEADREPEQPAESATLLGQR